MPTIISNGEWYKLHPEKVLGKKVTESGRFGEVANYKGERNAAVAAISAPEYQSDSDNISPWASVWGASTEEGLTARQKSNVRKALSVSMKERNNRILSRNAEDLDLITFDEVDSLYNAHLSEEEKRVFVWYMRAVKNVPMRGGWVKYHTNYTKTAIPLRWIWDGLVFYHQGEYLPAFLYFSGNINKRKKALEQDRENILSLKRGREVFQRQSEMLGEIWSKVLVKRRSLSAEYGKRLIIKPVSEFANTYKITQFNGGVDIELRVGGTGKIDFERKLTTRYDNVTAEENNGVTLNEAFVSWMGENPADYDIRGGLTWKDILDHYILKKSKRYEQGETKADRKRKQAIAEEEGNRLFSDFLANEITEEDRNRIEDEWNAKFNSEIPLQTDKVPIGFSMARYYGGMAMDIRPEKREAVAFAMLRGSACIAYGVGLGKTWCSIFTVAQFMENGWCERPVFVLPNQVYGQFIKEMNGILPHIPTNDLFNLSEPYLGNIATKSEVWYNADLGKVYDGEAVIDPVSGNAYTSGDGERFPLEKMEAYKAKSLSAGTVSFLTYEGMARMGLNDDGGYFDVMLNILAQENILEKSAKERTKEIEKIEGLVGKALAGTKVNIEDLGFDYLVVDEAHNARNLFTKMPDLDEKTLDGESKSIKRHYLQDKNPSDRALKVFMHSVYLQEKYRTGNVLLLTATPFQNSPLEVFSMTVLVGYRYLHAKGLSNLKAFFNEFAKTESRTTFGVDRKPQTRTVFVGFDNLSGLQEILQRFYLKKDGSKSALLKRPNKVVIPLKREAVNGKSIDKGGYDEISAVLPYSQYQLQFHEAITDFSRGGDLGQVCEKFEKLSQEEQDDARLLRAVGLARKLAVSPYLVCHNPKKGGSAGISPEAYIKSSAKLDYCVRCIESVKQWHGKRNEPVSGQIIYMNYGVDFFPLIREYLIKKVGFKPHEVKIIANKSRMAGWGFRDKETVKNAFLGLAFNPKTKEYEPLPDELRCKVIIGSSTIREGINLQNKTSVLYNLDLPWNPTDVEQLNGRLWRQGNAHKSVRIVVPLMEDGMDIFMFQKLEEKTMRINALWNYEERGFSLDTREFNPSELKYVLIKEAEVIAEMEADEELERVRDKIGSLERRIGLLDGFLPVRDSLRGYLKKAVEFLQDFHPTEIPYDVEKVLGMVREVVSSNKINSIKFKKNYGKILAAAREYHTNHSRYYGYSNGREEHEYLQEHGLYWYSGSKFPQWYNWMKQKHSEYRKIFQQVIAPMGYGDDLSDDAGAVFLAGEELKKELVAMKEQEGIYEGRIKVGGNGSPAEDGVGGSNWVGIRAKEIEAFREKNKIVARTVAQRVEEFAQLNYLLADRGEGYRYQKPQGTEPTPIYTKGERVKYRGKNAVVEGVIKGHGKPFYLVKQGKYEEYTIEAALSPTTKAQRLRIGNRKAASKPSKQKLKLAIALKRKAVAMLELLSFKAAA